MAHAETSSYGLHCTQHTSYMQYQSGFAYHVLEPVCVTAQGPGAPVPIVCSFPAAVCLAAAADMFLYTRKFKSTVLTTMRSLTELPSLAHHARQLVCHTKARRAAGVAVIGMLVAAACFAALGVEIHLQPRPEGLTAGTSA